MNKEVNAAVYKLQLSLLDGIENEQQLVATGSIMSRNDYNDVVTERSLTNLCGYPLCCNPLPSNRQQRKGRYRISLKEHKVYDTHETNKFCSTACGVSSSAFAASLQEERTSVLSSKVDKIVSLFEGFEIKEKEESKAGEVVAGPSDAIEGYITQPRAKPSIKKKVSFKEGDKVGSNKQKQNGKQSLVYSDMDFMSTIITDSEYSVSKLPPSVSTEIMFNSKSEQSEGKDSFKNLKDQFINVESYGSCQTGTDIKIAEVEKGTTLEKGGPSSATNLKPSLKPSGSKKLGRSVTWADEKTDSCSSDDLCKVDETGDTNDEDDFNDDPMSRMASAEACAMAMIQAADVMESGNYSDANEAVSEAGIIILPHPHDVDEEKSEEDGASDLTDEASIKWPSKPGIPKSELFDPEDSWYDSPPEGFSLTLSSFATMWMAIFGWITSSSLAYIYGKDESFQDEYLSVNGREYPRKIVTRDGRSHEIKQMIAASLSRVCPNLIAELRVPVPVYSLEKAVGSLLETMSFMDALPAFRMKQWQVIAMLFMDALSVCRIPALTPHMTNRTMLLRKVLDNSQITVEEYEVMKDFVMPLGRAPQFSMQSGA